MPELQFVAPTYQSELPKNGWLAQTPMYSRPVNAPAERIAAFVRYFVPPGALDLSLPITEPIDRLPS